MLLYRSKYAERKLNFVTGNYFFYNRKKYIVKRCTRMGTLRAEFLPSRDEILS